MVRLMIDMVERGDLGRKTGRGPEGLRSVTG